MCCAAASPDSWPLTEVSPRPGKSSSEWSARLGKSSERLAIAEAVLNSTDHPTVQQIYERVRNNFPSMTLATIYSTLGVLERNGLIQELPFERMSRYEPTWTLT